MEDLVKGDYDSFKKFVERLETPLGQKVREYASEHALLYSVCPASRNYHRQYSGGLIDHIQDVYRKFNMLSLCFNFKDFSDESLIIACVLHDNEKLFKYMPYYLSQELQERWMISSYLGEVPHELFPIIDFQLKMETTIPMDIHNMIVMHMGGYSRAGFHPTSLRDLFFYFADNLSARENIESGNQGCWRIPPQ